jgi:hypothetical protein
MEIQVGKKMFVKIDEYEGTYKITQGYHDKDGNFKPEFCKVRNYETQDYTDKRSLSVYMGKGEDGRSNLLALAALIISLYGNPQTHKKQDVPEQQPLDDVPF